MIVISSSTTRGYYIPRRGIMNTAVATQKSVVRSGGSSGDDYFPRPPKFDGTRKPFVFRTTTFAALSYGSQSPDIFIPTHSANSVVEPMGFLFLIGFILLSLWTGPTPQSRPVLIFRQPSPLFYIIDKYEL